MFVQIGDAGSVSRHDVAQKLLECPVRQHFVIAENHVVICVSPSMARHCVQFPRADFRQFQQMFKILSIGLLRSGVRHLASAFSNRDQGVSRGRELC